jgi:HD-like signal output (HDOD) protein
VVGLTDTQIAKSLQLPKSEVEDAFIGGLLHELGRLILACNYPERYEAAMIRVRQQRITVQKAEWEVFGTTHAEVGAYLLWLWGLPNGVTEIVARYDRPGSALSRGPLMAVHVADALIGAESGPDLDLECVIRMGLIDHLPEWRQLREALRPEVGMC